MNIERIKFKSIPMFTEMASSKKAIVLTTAVSLSHSFYSMLELQCPKHFLVLRNFVK